MGQGVEHSLAAGEVEVGDHQADVQQPTDDDLGFFDAAGRGGGVTSIAEEARQPHGETQIVVKDENGSHANRITDSWDFRNSGHLAGRGRPAQAWRPALRRGPDGEIDVGGLAGFGVNGGGVALLDQVFVDFEDVEAGQDTDLIGGGDARREV